MNIQSKINKLLKALEYKGQIYLVNKEQFLSKENNKICSVYKLFHLMDIEEYNILFNDNKDIDKYDFVKVKIESSCDQLKILLKLVDIYKEVGVLNG